jgi:hypothetical protein
MAVADVDVQRIRLERLRTPTFAAAAAALGHPQTRFRRIVFAHGADARDIGLARPIDRFPFVPDDPAKLDLDCYEAFNIQVQGLRKRLEVTNGERIVIGVSGGLDSTHALIVAARTFDALGIPRKNILGFTMPGFATSDKTKGNAWARSASPGRRSTSSPPRGRCSPTSIIRSRAANPCTTSRSRTCRRGCAPITCSASPTSAARSCSAPATCPSSRSAGARMAWAIT